jgi:ribose/xylose/arabinose/galactoside ABC-type transport system permease subunit
MTPDNNRTTSALTSIGGLWSGGWKLRLIPFVALTLLVLGFTVLAPARFPTASNLHFIVIQSAVIAVIALGETFVIIAGSIDLSVGSVVALSGVTGAITANRYGILAGIAVGLATGAAVGLFNGLCFAGLRVPSFIVTLGTLSIARGLTVLISGSQPIVLQGDIGNLGVPPGIYIVAGIAIGIGIILLRYTSFGRYTMAIGGQERVAIHSGVPVRRIKVLLFVLAGTAAGLGGLVMSGRVGAATPTAATGMELTAIAAVVLGGTPLTGGIGGMLNTVIGAFIITILLNGLVILGVSSEMQLVFQGLVLIAAVLLSLDRRKIGIIK